ncbi:MAG: response regulator [Alphaproteobacteria bacterium]|jgi:CheY-like chemotaxis protein|nr:response regulator [Alphaproteobacteria bacterium]MCZ6839624.1 response regulator [Alphaproteobacteria bacterium]
MSSGVLSNLTVLVVDDEEPIRELICGILDSFGIRKIRQASDGLVAFKDMQSHAPDAVITDLEMKPIDGLAFTRAVRTDPDCPVPDVPILMVTGHCEKHHVEEARDAGVTEFIAMPVTANTIAERLTSAIEKPRSFVRARNFVGPERRRRQLPLVSTASRRASDLGHEALATA